MFLGIDVSTYLEQTREANSKYYIDGEECNPFDTFKANGVSYIRIRVWNRPYSDEGKPYLAGTCDLDNFIALAKKLKPYNFKYIIDFHYSDFWCDPSKQFIPKDWENLSYEELVEALYKFTKESLEKVKKEGIDIDMAQIGNEITHGMLWPYGKILYGEGEKESWDRLASFLKAGMKALKEVYPNAKSIIHLEESYNQDLYRNYLTNIIARGAKPDVVGSSYYPFWHHDYDSYFANMDMVQREFGIEVMNAELGYPFTLEDYKLDEYGKPKHLVINADNIEDFMKMMPYPCTPEGQAQFVKTFIKLAKEHGLIGVCYWEPMWVPGNNICWASKAGQQYQNDTSKDTRVDWSNQCMFDYEGNALPSLKEFKI